MANKISKIYTPKEYVMMAVARYPTLYSCSTYDEVAVKVYEQLFNVIGNGIRDHEELMEHIAYTGEVDVALAEKYITTEPLIYGYENLREIAPGITMPDGYSKLVCLESEKHLHLEIKKWITAGQYPWKPYPNYKEEYSIVYRSDFKTLGNEWIDAAIWYYERAREYMQTMPLGYHGAYPTNDAAEDERTIQSYQTFMSRYKTNEEVSEAYGVEYNGNLKEMVAARWQKEHARIKEFIDNTIVYLQAMKV